MKKHPDDQGGLHRALPEGKPESAAVSPSRERKSKKQHSLLIAGFRTLDLEMTLLQRDDTYLVRKCRVQPYAEQARIPVPDKDAGIAALVSELATGGISGPLARLRCARFGF
ncbi:hypothetical protein [Cupriavidus basilensis]|uniref:hypothetical protein n=1 Tax=Cupriavidus basilensis TaxID=68895 RepID=UPI0039F735EF